MKPTECQTECVAPLPTDPLMHHLLCPLLAVAAHLASLYPNALRVAMGFSQGSNVLVQVRAIHIDQ